MSTPQKLRIVALAILAGCSMASRVAAEPHGERFGHEEPHREGRAPERFERREGPRRDDAWRVRDDAHLARWRGGHWFHGDHLGRPGWWWIVGDEWFFYPAVVYPYPDPYVPPTAVAQAPAQAPAQAWYYCPSQNAYYPYVTTCPDGWQPVQPTP